MATASLMFYISHGNPENWTTQGNPAEPDTASTSCMLIGDKANGLRYYWHCACQVFAHGPRSGKDELEDYKSPGEFDVENFEDDSPSMRNVISRWAPALGQGLRMACGSSTRVLCSEGDMEKIWSNKKAGIDVADSFIGGLHSRSEYVPLCLARGSGDEKGMPDPRGSSLYDEVFSNEKNCLATGTCAGTGEYYYIQYIIDLGGVIKQLQPRSPQPSRPKAEGEDEVKLAVYNVEEPSRDLSESIIRGIANFFQCEEQAMLDDGTLVYRNPCINREPLRALCPDDAVCLSGDWYKKRAREFIKEIGWEDTVDQIGPAKGFRILIDSYNQETGERSNFQKSVIVEFRRVVRKINLSFFPPLIMEDGGSGRIVVQLNHKGEVWNAWKKWPAKLKSREIKSSAFEAELEALTMLNYPEDYELVSREIIYRQVGQELAPFWVFDFEAREMDNLLSLPSRRIEISAENGR